MHTMANPLARAARTNGTDLAAVCGSSRLTYAETDNRCRRLVGALRELGCQPGDRVAVIAANCHRYLELYQAIPSGGFVIVPLNTRHTPGELAYALRDAGVRVLVTDRAGDEMAELAGLVERVVSIPDEYEALLAAGPAAPLGENVRPEDLAGLFYTGGTTGKAKGVMLTHANLVANAWNTLACTSLTGADRWLVAAPLFHAAGSVAVLAQVWTGGVQVVLPGFDPGAALDLIAVERCTATLAVPTMAAALADEQLRAPRDVSSLRLLSHGGSPIATEVIRRAHAAFPDAELLHLYGATETAPLATALPHEERELDSARIRSCGQPMLGVTIKVLAADGGEAGVGEVGEVAIYGPNVMTGYWGKPTETAAALQDGWYRSGDLGYLDEAAYLFLVDRAKDMIVTGGENVYSTEVEDALYAHPAVLEAAVFGVPDDDWGEAVFAVVVARTPVSSDELRVHCRGFIAGYKVPKRIELTEVPLPKSGAGKILKRELREPYWADHQGRV